MSVMAELKVGKVVVCPFRHLNENNLLDISINWVYDVLGDLVTFRIYENSSMDYPIYQPEGCII